MVSWEDLSSSVTSRRPRLRNRAVDVAGAEDAHGRDSGRVAYRLLQSLSDLTRIVKSAITASLTAMEAVDPRRGAALSLSVIAATSSIHARHASGNERMQS